MVDITLGREVNVVGEERLRVEGEGRRFEGSVGDSSDYRCWDLEQQTTCWKNLAGQDASVTSHERDIERFGFGLCLSTMV